MKQKVFSLAWQTTCKESAGFSLVELLVTLLVSSVMMTAVATFFSASVGMRHTASMRVEATQGLRVLLQTITQETRQAGACLTGLPRAAIGGINNGTLDGLTVRIGRVDPLNQTCIQRGISTATAPPIVGDTVVRFMPPNPGFQVGTYIYIAASSGAGGTYSVTAVGAVNGSGEIPLTLSSPLLNVGAPYNTGNISAIDERIYGIDTAVWGTPTRPVLTVRMNGDAQQPLVAGVTVFDVKYYIGPCTPDSTGAPICSAIRDIPATATEWQLVTKLGIKATVRAHTTDKNGQVVEETTGQPNQPGEYINIKPRNLLT